MAGPDGTIGADDEEAVRQERAARAAEDAAAAEARGAHRARASVGPVIRALAVTVAGRQRPPRRRRGRSPRLLPLLALLVSAVVCAALIGAVQLKSHFDAQAAAAEGVGFTPPPLAQMTPGPAGAQLIAVVGDEWASPRNSVTNRPWTYRLQRSIGVRVRALASDGGAYVPGAVGAGGAPFSTGAGSIPPTSSVVVFFGGARDATDRPAELAAAATQALADAAARAPQARLVVVGPVPSRPGRSAELTPMRAVLKTVAQTARADFVDPVQEKWLDTSSLWSATDPAPSSAGNQRLADRMSAMLTPLLSGTSS